MKYLSKFSKYMPSIYFLAVVGYWFTDINSTEEITAFPILLFGIPFLWQIIKPSSNLNLTLKITFVCSALYLILSNIFQFSIMPPTSDHTADLVIYGGLLAILFYTIQMWVVKNSLRRSF